MLDFDYNEYDRNKWGKVTLYPDFHNGWNQRWQFMGGEIACKGYGDRQVPNLRLDVFSAEKHNGAKVGVYQRNGGKHQKWSLKEEGSRSGHHHGDHGGHGSHGSHGSHGHQWGTFGGGWKKPGSSSSSSSSSD